MTKGRRRGTSAPIRRRDPRPGSPGPAPGFAHRDSPPRRGAVRLLSCAVADQDYRTPGRPRASDAQERLETPPHRAEVSSGSCVGAVCPPRGGSTRGVSSRYSTGLACHVVGRVGVPTFKGRRSAAILGIRVEARSIRIRSRSPCSCRSDWLPRCMSPPFLNILSNLVAGVRS